MSLKLESTTTELRNGLNLAWYHHLTHITLWQKTGCISCTKWTIFFKVRAFQTKTQLLQRHFIFLNLFQLKIFFCIQYAPFKATFQNFNPFRVHLVLFMHLMIYFELSDPEIGKHYK